MTAAARAPHGGAAADDSVLADACDLVYRRLLDALAAAGVTAAQVAQLQHYTASQHWLGVRQRVRARHFGSPARLASFGVPMPWGPTCWLSAAAIGLRMPHQLDQVIAGADHGMPAIATAVCSGDTAFLSGLLRNGAALTAAAAVDDVLNELEGILASMSFGLHDLLTLELFVAEASTIDIFIGIAQHRWGSLPALCAVVAVAESGLVLELAAVVARQRDNGAELSAASLSVLPERGTSCIAADVVDRCGRLTQSWCARGHRLARVTLHVPAQFDDAAVLDAMEASVDCPVIVVPANQPQVTGLLIGGAA